MLRATSNIKQVNLSINPDFSKSSLYMYIIFKLQKLILKKAINFLLL